LSPLRVAVETQFAVRWATGLGVYAASLASALRARRDVDVVELCDPRFDLWRFDRRLYWDLVACPALARRSAADVIHLTGGTLPLRPRRPVVLTLHDLVWMRAANRGRFYVRWYYGALQPRLARAADAIVVDTERGRDDIVDGLGVPASRVFVGGAGVGEEFFSIDRAPADPPFALCVGTVEERKDLATAVRAIATLPDVQLVSVGPLTPYADEVRAAAAAEGFAHRLQLRGYVDARTLRDLYARASVLVFPSRYEGFGLPPLQALACGLPVAAAGIPVTREVLGNCARYAPAGDAAALAAALEEVLNGGAATAQRVALGRVRAREFTWARVAERMTALYRTLV